MAAPRASGVPIARPPAVEEGAPRPGSMTDMQSPALVADIGGTHARFALAELSRPRPRLFAEQKLRCEDYPSLAHAAQAYLDGAGARPRRAAMALACPILGEDVSMTNRAWSFRRGDLARALGLESLQLLNDFGAVARAVPVLIQRDYSVIHPGRTGIAPRPPVTVLGPGTGLGMALLVPHGAHWTAVETEGGHVTFAPIDDVDRAIARWFGARFERVSNERVLCGDGIAGIHQALAEMEGRAVDPLTSADIVARAVEHGDADATRTLDRFCAILGAVTGDAALVHGAGRVVIAGGLVPRFPEIFKRSDFLARYLAKGRFAEYLARAEVVLLTHPAPGLLGAARALIDADSETPVAA